MRRSPQPLQRIIATDATLSAWQARYSREQALTALTRRQLPRQLGSRVHVRQLANGDLEIVAAAGAVAAAVRQRLPDVATALRREGFDPGALRVRVQVTAPAPEARVEARPPFDRAAAAPLVDLAAKLPAGALRAAIHRLLRRSR